MTHLCCLCLFLLNLSFRASQGTISDEDVASDGITVDKVDVNQAAESADNDKSSSRANGIDSIESSEIQITDETAPPFLEIIDSADHRNIKASHRRWILDTDPGLDDALAMLWLFQGLKDGLHHIDGITTIDGNIAGKQLFSNVVHMINLSMPTLTPSTQHIRDSLTQIPIAKQNRTDHEGTTTFFYGTDGLGGLTDDFKNYPDIFSSAQDINDKFINAPLAEDFIIETLLKFPHQISLLAIGPLSNLYLAEKKHPGILSLVKDIYIMGGSFGKGNVDALTEFNFHFDSEALYGFFEAINEMEGKKGRRRPNVFVLPLDVTKRLLWGEDDLNTLYGTLSEDKMEEIEMCRLKMEDMELMDEELNGMEEEMECTQSGLMYHFLEGMNQQMIVSHLKEGNGDKMELHDPAVIGFILYPHLFDLKHVHCQIDRRNGMISYDQRLLPPTHDTIRRPNCFVATDVNETLFVEMLTRDLLRIVNAL